MFDYDTPTRKKVMAWLLIIGIATGVVFGIWALAKIRKVGYDQYALKMNTLTGAVEPTAYGNGLYHAGLFGEFIKFPRTVQTISFNPHPGATTGVLHAITGDGLSLSVDISYQYQLHGDELYELMHEFSTNYIDAFVKVSRDVLRDVCANFTAIEFLTDRLHIGNAMEVALHDAFQDLYADITGFQLTNIDLPDVFEEALQNVKVAEQEKAIAEFLLQAEIIRAETLLVGANATAELALIMGLNSTELLQYLWIQAILAHQGTLIIGTDVPVILG